LSIVEKYSTTVTIIVQLRVSTLEERFACQWSAQ